MRRAERLFRLVRELRSRNISRAEDLAATFEISVRNRKREAAEVVVREYLYRWSAWDLTAKSHAFTKRDAQTIDFPVTIAADGEAKLTYTVRYHW